MYSDQDDSDPRRWLIVLAVIVGVAFVYARNGLDFLERVALGIAMIPVYLFRYVVQMILAI